MTKPGSPWEQRGVSSPPPMPCSRSRHRLGSAGVCGGQPPPRASAFHEPVQDHVNCLVLIRDRPSHTHYGPDREAHRRFLSGGGGGRAWSPLTQISFFSFPMNLCPGLFPLACLWSLDRCAQSIHEGMMSDEHPEAGRWSQAHLCGTWPGAL